MTTENPFDKLEAILPKESWDWGIRWENGPQLYYCWVVYGEDDIKKSALNVTPMKAVCALEAILSPP